MTKSIMENEEDYYGQSHVCNMTSEEFELYCLEILRGYAEQEGLKDFSINHNVKIETNDGTYQIDILASFRAVGTQMTLVGECKRHKNAVKREIVAALADKVRSLGAQKGIILSTAGFQKGAVKYAKVHGIALVQIFDTRENWYYHSGGPDVVEDEEDPITYPEKHLPVFCAKLIEDEAEFNKSIYPTRKMLDKVRKEQDELFKKVYGYSMLERIREYIENHRGS